MAKELQGITLLDLAGMGPSTRCVRVLVSVGFAPGEIEALRAAGVVG